MPRLRPTPQLTAQVAAGIRAGAFAHVAAAARGLAPRLFVDWLMRGQRRRAGSAYSAFAAEVETAAAQARLRAEMNVFETEPRAWLLHGPGKDTVAARGWSAAVRLAPDDSTPGPSALADEALFALLGQLAAAARPQPEVRDLLLRLIDAVQPGRRAA